MRIKVRFFTLKGLRINDAQSDAIRLLLEYELDGTFKHVILLTKTCSINNYIYKLSLHGGLLNVTSSDMDAKKYFDSNKEEFNIAINNFNCNIVQKMVDNILF